MLDAQFSIFTLEKYMVYYIASIGNRDNWNIYDIVMWSLLIYKTMIKYFMSRLKNGENIIFYRNLPVTVRNQSYNRMSEKIYITQ